MNKQTICLDFDGVVHSYKSGWQGMSVIPDPPVDGTKDAIERLRVWYVVVIHSTRCKTTEGRNAIRNWLRKNHIVVDEICDSKPPAVIYVDDRGIRFRDWIDCMAEIRSLRVCGMLEEIERLRNGK